MGFRRIFIIMSTLVFGLSMHVQVYAEESLAEFSVKFESARAIVNAERSSLVKLNMNFS